MNQAIKSSLRAKAIKEYNCKQFGCEKVEIIKAYSVKTRKPVTVFEFHHDWGTLVQDREHANEMVQNVEHNGNRVGMEKFINNFIKKEVDSFKARKRTQKAQANSLENLCPALTNLKLA